MPTIGVLFTGADLEDVFVYRSTVYAWTFDRRLRIYALSAFEEAIERADRNLGGAISYWLFHGRGLGASTKQRRARDESSLKSPHLLTVDLSGVPYREKDLHADVGSVLDIVAYYDTLYLASDGGLFAAATAQLHDDNGGFKPVRAVESECISASAGLGAIAASCGIKGLHIVFDSFDSPANLGRRVTDVSIRAEVGAGSVVNHPSRSEVEFLAADTRFAKSARGNVLSDVRPAMTDGGLRDVDPSADNDESARFILWDQQRLVVFRSDGVTSVGVASDSDHRRYTSSRHLAPAASTRVISACRIGRSFVAETTSGVTVLPADSAPLDLNTGPVIGLRSYQRSLRYRRIATVTAETGLWFLGVAPDVSEAY